MSTAAAIKYPTALELALRPRQEYIDWMVDHCDMTASEAGSEWDGHEAREYGMCECGKPVPSKGRICDTCLIWICENTPEELIHWPEAQAVDLETGCTFAEMHTLGTIPVLQPVTSRCASLAGIPEFAERLAESNAKLDAEEMEVA